MECPRCDGEMIIKKIPYNYKDRTYLGDFKAEVCTKCGVEYFKQKSFRKIERQAKQFKIWGNAIPKIELTAVSRDFGDENWIEFKSLFPQTSIPIYYPSY